jgi:hypothetical protein
MCAGLAVLQRLQDGDIYQQLETLGARLEGALASIPRLAVQRVGSIFWFCASQHGRPATPIRSRKEFSGRRQGQFRAPFHALLEGGIYLAPSAFEVGFLSAAHSDAQIDQLARRCRRNSSSSAASSVRDRYAGSCGCTAVSPMVWTTPSGDGASTTAVSSCTLCGGHLELRFFEILIRQHAQWPCPRAGTSATAAAAAGSHARPRWY